MIEDSFILQTVSLETWLRVQLEEFQGGEAGCCCTHTYQRAHPVIRHFDFSRSIGGPQQGPDMQAFLQLVTLRLRFRKHECRSVNNIDLDLSYVQSLRSLHIENWSPKSISVTASCQLTAVWQQPEVGSTRLWLHSPCWRDPAINLALLHVQDKHECIWHSDTRQIHAIHETVACQDGLEALRIEAMVWGSEEGPFSFPSCLQKDPDSALRIEISTIKGCWLLVDEFTPFNGSVVLSIEGPLHVGVIAASGSLQWYKLEGNFASNSGGELSSLHLQLARAMARAKDHESEKIGDVMADQAAAHVCGALWLAVLCPWICYCSP